MTSQTPEAELRTGGTTFPSPGWKTPERQRQVHELRYNGTMRTLCYTLIGERKVWSFCLPALPRGRFRLFDPKARRYVAWTSSPARARALLREAEKRGWNYHIAF